jgi:hypothetical protein
MAKRKSGGNAPRQPLAGPAPAARNYPVVATPEKVEARERKSRWIQRGVLGAVCALVVGVYAYTAHEGAQTQPGLDAASSYYNLLVEGFRAGQLNVKKDVPPGLAQLADPYTATALRPHGVMDLSYYRGKLYLYFGVTPAVVLFWPYVALTGQYLFYRQAVTIFCAIGFLASIGDTRWTVAALLCRSQHRGGGRRRTGTWLGYIHTVALGSVRGLRGSGQLRVYADNVGTGRHLARVTGDGAGVAVAGRSKCGVRAGSGGATRLVVRRGRPAGSGDSGVA